jgi:hypothetical protein
MMNEREAYLRALAPETAEKVQIRRLAENVREEIEIRENREAGALWLLTKFPSEDEPGTFDAKKMDDYLAAIARGEVSVEDVHEFARACIYFTGGKIVS